MSQDRLVQALSAELDASRSAGRFDKERADRAEQRVRELQQELERVQTQLRQALSRPSSSATQPMPRDELTQRLKLALDSNHRLERARGKEERKAVALQAQLDECRELARRWEQRARALEGQLKLLG